MLDFKFHEYICVFCACFMTSLIYYLYKADCNWEIDTQLILIFNNKDLLELLLLQGLVMEVLFLCVWVFGIAVSCFVLALGMLIVDTIKSKHK